MNKDSTPLKALYDLFENPFYIELGRVQGKTRFNKDIQIIEKALKALEIIKEKTKYFIDFEENTKTIYIDCALNCNTEQFDLLKEVLK